MFDENNAALPATKSRKDMGDKLADVRKDLDGQDARDLQRRLIEFYRCELDRQEANRFQQLIDHDFYDSCQWSEEDARELEARGQAPTVMNMIAPAVNWILGTEKRTRMDAKVIARKPAEEKAAEIKTQLLKYLSDVNRTPYSFSKAFEDSVKSGVGWIEDCIADPDSEREPIATRYEDWRAIVWDSAAKDDDLSDARYIIRTKVLDSDMALAIFPNRAAQINAACKDAVGAMGANDDDTDDAMMSSEELDESSYAVRSTGSTMQRRRVRMFECWYTVPRRVKRLRGGAMHGQDFNENNAEHRTAVMSGDSRIVEVNTMQMRVAVFTSRDLLWDSKTPYLHNRFPFTPIWGYRRKRDGMPYGLIRHLRDIQVDLNKRASKSLFILSTNKVIVGENNVTDWEEFEEAVTLPNGIIKVRNIEGIKINVDRDLAAGHLDMMSRDAQMIQTVSGVTDELLGRTTNAVSGRAITARQEQGSLATSTFFSNLRFGRQVSGEKRLANVEQFMTERRTVRILGQAAAKLNAEYVEINDPDSPDSLIDRTKADYIVDEMDWNATWRNAMAEQLLELVQKLTPEMAAMMMDLVVEMLDVPNKDEILKRIRNLTGMGDSEGNPTPEQQQQQQAAAMQQQMAMKQQELAIAELEAKVAEAQARAMKAQAEAGRIKEQTIRERVGSMADAAGAATQLLSTPAAGVTADSILNDAGFVTETEATAKAAKAAALDKVSQMAAQHDAAQGSATPPDADMIASGENMADAGAPAQAPTDAQAGGMLP